MWFCGWNGHPSMFVCVVLTSSFVLVCVLFPCWSIFFSHVNIFKTKTFILIWNILLKSKVMIQNALIKKIIKGNVAILKSERRATLQFMINFLPVLALIRTVWIHRLFYCFNFTTQWTINSCWHRNVF